MGNLPLARTQTFDNTTPVASGVLNELQDTAILGGYNYRYGRPSLAPMANVGFAQKGFTVFAGLTIGGSVFVSTAVNAGLLYGVPADEGDTVAGVALDVLGTGQPVTIQVFVGTAAQFDAFAGLTTLVTETWSPAAGWARVVWPAAGRAAFTPHRLLATEQIWAVLQVNNHVGVEFAGIRSFVGRVP